ncbi:ribbon-helix-helix domain-containing protein [Novosphingobium indicum]|nr:ribbon-helix-helix domain-containing protein [Novosphingobium indicum]
MTRKMSFVACDTLPAGAQEVSPTGWKFLSCPRRFEFGAFRGQDNDPLDCSKFIEEAVIWRLFDLTLDEARTGFADIDPESLETLIDEAVFAARGRP